MRPNARSSQWSALNAIGACADCNLDRQGGQLPKRAALYGRSKRDIEREIWRQTAISIEPGSALYQRAATIAPTWYPEHFARKARARDAWARRAAASFDFGDNVTEAA